MICSRCAVTVPDNSVSCPNCGLAFQNIQTVFCSTCGTRLRADAAFCSTCGQALQGAGQVPMSGVTTGMAYPTTETSGKAIASMILGILSLFFSIIVGIPAIILGHLSLSQVKKSGGRISGEGMAMTGLILGYVSVAVAPLLLMITLPNLTRSRAYANQAAAASNVRTLVAVETMYSTTYPNDGYAPDLATLGPGGQTCAGEPTKKNACLIDATLGCINGTSGRWCVRDQYKFSIVGVKEQDSKVPTDFIITATPVDTRSGRTSYCATSDGIIRFRSGQVLTPIETVSQCTEWIPL